MPDLGAAPLAVALEVTKILLSDKGPSLSRRNDAVLTSYGFDLDEDTETADLRALRERHTVAATRVEGGREPFAIEEAGSIVYGATVKMRPDF